MNIYPAIDLYEGKVVRLSKGDFTKQTVYSDQPAAMATKWENQGAKWLHVVDLEGAKTGEIRNLGMVREIRKKVKCQIQFGGGVRSFSTIEMLLNEGINRVVIGTKALEENFLRQVVSRFGNQIAVGLDVRDGKIQTKGWVESTETTLEFMLKEFDTIQAGTLIYTDIQKDGMMQGPNFTQLSQVLEKTKASVILSGGVGSLSDLSRCSTVAQRNFEGVIIGKALYQEAFTLTAALKAINPALY